MKIEFVQLESDAFLTDIDVIKISAAESGVWKKFCKMLTIRQKAFRLRTLEEIALT
ncbi:hypothetical protein ES703_22180 [subsurface metagenome]